DVRAISAASAISEVSAQQDQLRSGASASSAASTTTPLLAEETAISEVEEIVQETDEPIPEEETGELEVVTEEIVAQEPELSPQLELVPPSEASDLDSASGFEESEDSSVDASVAASALREDLARTEEELITQQQQNEYLAERIKELESQLVSTETGNVENADMANMEDRLREQRLAEAAAAKESENTHWYNRISAWLIGLLILAAAAAGWWLSRRGSGNEFVPGADDGQLREIKDEAEELLRVLNDSGVPDAPAGALDEAGKPEKDTAAQGKNKLSTKSIPAGQENASVLDEESSDPEIQLDLARAYISMGDREAARVILEEVGNNGNEEQRNEAKKMLNLLTP
ncbi:MAG: tetratricopeptide repeat protein, partial [Xanthomonadales bacterium]|nr:tetratricopeptide repeat protein [Xanthomonadales bacterium]